MKKVINSWFVIILLPCLLMAQTEFKLTQSSLFFSYTNDELDLIKRLSVSGEKLTREKFEKWDSLLYEVTSHPKPDGISNRLFAYLYVAQREFSLLGYQFSAMWNGNPDFLINRVIQLFYPDFHTTITSDPYSKKIGELVLNKIEERFKKEQNNLKEYPEIEEKNYWKEKPPYEGLRIGSCIPWLISSFENLKAPQPPPPGSLIWKYGINEIKYAQSRLTPEQRRLIFFWAGQEGPESGNWFFIANQLLHKKELSLPQFLFIRAIFAMSFVNAMIGVFDSKYTYWVMRPHMIDPSVTEIVKCPIHPSYPSAHSATASTSTTILSHFFPEDAKKIESIAFESCNTRIWGGLHFMYDNEEGIIQGEKIGKATLKYLEDGKK